MLTCLTILFCPGDILLSFSSLAGAAQPFLPSLTVIRLCRAARVGGVVSPGSCYDPAEPRQHCASIRQCQSAVWRGLAHE